MKKGMQLSLKAGERVFINGAVLRADRKVTIELLNDVTFLLESHVLQPEQATTPLRQLYFIMQTMLMDPANAEGVKQVFEGTHRLMLATFENEEVLQGLRSVGELVAAGRVFDALKTIRGLYRVEDEILSRCNHACEEHNDKREVA